MGLDMYLEAKRFFYSSEREKIKLEEIIPEGFNIQEIIIEVGYWRKANQIHNWFVENVQDGNDDCGDYWVNRKDLEKLLFLCKEVLEKSQLIKGTIKNGWKSINGEGLKPVYEDGEVIVDPSIAEKLLPTTSGFFFGNTDYNEYYIHDIKNTIKIIEKALTLPKEWSIYYNSSW